LAEYDQQALHQHIGFVFQDSIMFNISIRENIAFNSQVSDQDLTKAIAAAELTDFIASLPQGLDTLVSERGASLSGGQKQRIMLARALAINPTILFLDDFTARVDTVTETKILHNLKQSYPHLTLLSVTQKIASVTSYDQVLLLMEGDLLASGTHQQLLKSSPEYMQIYATQQSANTYELHPE
jgi:ATP-binding cassette subfamily B protein